MRTKKRREGRNLDDENPAAPIIGRSDKIIGSVDHQAEKQCRMVGQEQKRVETATHGRDSYESGCNEHHPRFFISALTDSQSRGHSLR